jgi:hypothetical protein
VRPRHISFKELANFLDIRYESHPLERQYVGFEVLTAMTMKSSVFWDVTLCSPEDIHLRFGETYCLHLQVEELVQQA